MNTFIAVILHKDGSTVFVLTFQKYFWVEFKFENVIPKLEESGKDFKN